MSRGKKPEERGLSIQSFVGRDEEELLDWAYANRFKNASKQSEELRNNYPERYGYFHLTQSSGNASKEVRSNNVLSLGPKSSGQEALNSVTDE